MLTEKEYTVSEVVDATRISESSVRRVLRAFTETGSTISLPRSTKLGRRKILDDEDSEERHLSYFI